MPIYVYTCSRCGGQVELKRPVAQRNWDVICTDCDRLMERKPWLSTAFILKGEGWPGKDK